MGRGILKFTDYSISFIYSFLLDLNSKTEFVGDDDGNSPLKKLADCLKSDGSDWKSDKPEDRVGVTSNLSVDGHKSLYWNSGKTEFELGINRNERDKDYSRQRLNENFSPLQCCLEAFIRINDTGVGSLTLTITPKKSDDDTPYSSLDIHNLHNLVGITKDDPPYFRLTNIRGDDLPLLEPTDGASTTLFKCFCDILDKNVISKLSTTMSDIWLDKVAIDKSAGGGKSASMCGTEWQNPFVMTHVVLDEEFDAANNQNPWWYFTEEDKTHADYDEKRKKRQELVVLQSRFLKGRLVLLDREQHYVYLKSQTKYQPHLRNFSWHKDVFIGYHGRGGTIVSFKAQREAALLTELHESYLDLMEIIRTRWHFCVVFDELLSHEFTKITLLDRDSLKEKMMEFSELFLKRREMFIRFMSDPTTYAYEGGVVSEICGHARKSFYIDDMRKNLFEKFSAIERYYKEHVDYITYVEL